MAIILNIDEDHLDYFSDLDHIIDTFKGYARNLKEDSYLLANIDDPSMGEVIRESKAKLVTFGFSKEADYRAEEVNYSEDGYPSFILNIKNKKKFPLKLKVMGKHNIYNSLASIAAAHIYGVNIEEVLKNMSLYNGVHRRLEFKGNFNGAHIYDDYATTLQRLRLH